MFGGEEKTRYVRTPEGERHFGQPIGTPITEGAQRLLPDMPTTPEVGINPHASDPQAVVAREGARADYLRMDAMVTEYYAAMGDIYQSGDTGLDAARKSADLLKAFNAEYGIYLEDVSDWVGDGDDERYGDYSTADVVAMRPWAYFGACRQIRVAAYELVGYDDESGRSVGDPFVYNGSAAPRWGGATTLTPHPEAMAYALMTAVHEANHTDMPLYRGIDIEYEGTPEDFVAALREGDSFDMPLASFTDKKIIADKFGSSVTMVLMSGARAYNGGGMGAPEEADDPDSPLYDPYRDESVEYREYISGGRFVVQSVHPRADGGTYIYIRQKQTFDPDSGLLTKDFIGRAPVWLDAAFDIPLKQWRAISTDGVKVIRRVRTPEGVARYGKPIGSPIESEFDIPAMGSVHYDQDNPPPYLYRAVSEEDWASIVENGYIQSDGRMNIADNEGTVAADRDPSFYLPNGVGEQGRIIRIAFNPEDGWWKDSDGYWKTPSRVPLDRVDMATPPYIEQVPPSDYTYARLIHNLTNRINNAVIDTPGYNGYGVVGDFREREYPLARLARNNTDASAATVTAYIDGLEQALADVRADIQDDWEQSQYDALEANVRPLLEKARRAMTRVPSPKQTRQKMLAGLVDTKTDRYVRTPEGSERYGLPIGARIGSDFPPMPTPLHNIRVGDSITTLQQLQDFQIGERITTWDDRGRRMVWIKTDDDEWLRDNGNMASGDEPLLDYRIQYGTVDTPEEPSLAAGDKITSVDQLNELPIGSVIRYYDPQSGYMPDDFVKVTDSKWQDKFEIGHPVSDFANAITVGRLTFERPDAPEKESLAVGDTITGASDLDRLPVGAVFGFSEDDQYIKQEDGRWVEYPRATQYRFRSGGFDFHLFNGTVYSLDGRSKPSSDLEGTFIPPAVGTIFTTTDELDALPPGSVIRFDGDQKYVKQDALYWEADDGGMRLAAGYFSPEDYSVELVQYGSGDAMNADDAMAEIQGLLDTNPWSPVGERYFTTAAELDTIPVGMQLLDDSGNVWTRESNDPSEAWSSTSFSVPRARVTSERAIFLAGSLHTVPATYEQPVIDNMGKPSPDDVPELHLSGPDANSARNFSGVYPGMYDETTGELLPYDQVLSEEEPPDYYSDMDDWLSRMATDGRAEVWAQVPNHRNHLVRGDEVHVFTIDDDWPDEERLADGEMTPPFLHWGTRPGYHIIKVDAQDVDLANTGKSIRDWTYVSRSVSNEGEVEEGPESAKRRLRRKIKSKNVKPIKSILFDTAPLLEDDEANDWDYGQTWFLDVEDPAIEMVLDRVRETFEVTAGGLTSVVTDRDSKIERYGDTWTLEVNGIIVDDNGRKVGSFQRILDIQNDGSPTVSNEYLSIANDYQGQGFAEAFYLQVEETLEEQGYEYVRIHANIDIGGYAWARRGFDWDYDNGGGAADVEDNVYWTIPDMRTRFGDTHPVIAELQAMGDRIKNGEEPHPWEIAAIGEDDPTCHWTETTYSGVEIPMWPGKAALLGSSWYGKKPIDRHSAPNVKAMTPADYLAHIRSMIPVAETAFIPGDYYKNAEDSDYNIMGADLLMGPMAGMQHKRILGYVRTPEGVRKYRRPIGYPIFSDDTPMADMRSWERTQRFIQTDDLNENGIVDQDDAITETALHELLVSRMGSSNGVVYGDVPKIGYMVSLPPAEGTNEVVPMSDMQGETGISHLYSVLLAAREYIAGLADPTDVYLGTWVDDTQMVHIDVSLNIPELDKAVKVGRQNNQLAIWDVAEMQEIDTGGTGYASKSIGTIDDLLKAVVHYLKWGQAPVALFDVTALLRNERKSSRRAMLNWETK